MGVLTFVGIIPILINLGLLVFAIYVAINILKLMKQKNDYLKEIRDVIRKNNKVDQHLYYFPLPILELED